MKNCWENWGCSAAPVVTGQSARVLNWKMVDSNWTRGRVFYDEGGETVEQVAHRSCGCPVVDVAYDVPWF